MCGDLLKCSNICAAQSHRDTFVALGAAAIRDERTLVTKVVSRLSQKALAGAFLRWAGVAAQMRTQRVALGRAVARMSRAQARHACTSRAQTHRGACC